jgi:predicted aspartyl protease
MSPWRVKGQFRSDGLFVVPVWLNEKSFNFLFDPGAAFSTMSPQVAALLQLPVVGNRWILQGGYYPTNCPVYQLESFRIGFIRLQNMRIVEMPIDLNQNFNGLIGMDFLRHYRFTLECDTATLILRPLRK